MAGAIILVTGEIGPTSEDITFHFNAQDIKGVGLTSGDVYEVLDNAEQNMTFAFPPLTQSEKSDVRFRLIRHGSADNLWMRFSFTFTYPPGTFEITRDQLECRG